MSISAIIFDLDNTLSHRDLSVQAYSQHLDQYFSADLKQSSIDKILAIVRRIDNGGYPKKELLTQPSIGGSVAAALLKELDWQRAPSLEDLTEFWFKHFGAQAVAMPEAAALLAQLKAENYVLAVISNGGHATREAILAGLNFRQYFDVVMSSEQAGIAKPHADIFIQTAKALGCALEECIYIGDHPINDVLGAAEAGMQAVWLEGFHTGHTIEVPHFRIQHLAQLHSVLAHLN